MSTLWRHLEGLLHPGENCEWSLQDRLVIVDTETTGLNTRRDALLSIGAVAINRGRLALNDSFYRVLQTTTQPSADNVLVHRLTPGELKQASPPQTALREFLDYAGDTPLLAYHADFDWAVLKRACREQALPELGQAYIDVAHWFLLAEPELGHKPLTLEAATAYYRIHSDNRHNAHGDAVTTALLTLKLLQKTDMEGSQTVGSLLQRIRQNQGLHRLRH